MVDYGGLLEFRHEIRPQQRHGRYFTTLTGGNIQEKVSGFVDIHWSWTLATLTGSHHVDSMLNFGEVAFSRVPLRLIFTFMLNGKKQCLFVLQYGSYDLQGSGEWRDLNFLLLNSRKFTVGSGLRSCRFKIRRLRYRDNYTPEIGLWKLSHHFGSYGYETTTPANSGKSACRESGSRRRRLQFQQSSRHCTVQYQHPGDCSGHAVGHLMP